MQDLTDWFTYFPLFQSDLFSKCLHSLLIILLLWGGHWLINRFVRKRSPDLNTHYSWKTGTRYTFWLLGIILVGRLWVEGVHTIFTILGLIGAALTITQKEALMNLTGWGVILWRNLFVIGDRIQIGINQGDVVGMGPFYFTLMEIGNWVGGDQSTGRIVKVPNCLVWTIPVANYTRSFPYIWNEISFSITPDSDWENARKLLKEIGDKHTKEVGQKAQLSLSQVNHEIIIIKNMTPIVYMRPRYEKPSGYVLTLRYLCDPRQRRDREQEIVDDVLNELKTNDAIKLKFED